MHTWANCAPPWLPGEGDGAHFSWSWWRGAQHICSFIRLWFLSHPPRPLSRSSKGHWEGRLLPPAQAPAGFLMCLPRGQVCAGGRANSGQKDSGRR